MCHVDFESLLLKVFRHTVFLDNMRKKAAVVNTQPTSVTAIGNMIDTSLSPVEELHVPSVTPDPPSMRTAT